MNTVRVKLLVSRSLINDCQSPGDIVEVSAAEAKRMIASEQAVAVRGRPPERAVK